MTKPRRQTEEQRLQWAAYMRTYRASHPRSVKPARETDAGKTPTPRQLEILKAYADPLTGGSQRKVAEALGISPSAVHNQIARLLARLGVSTATQAVWKIHVEGKDEPTTPPTEPKP